MSEQLVVPDALAGERLAPYGDRVQFIRGRFSQVDADAVGGAVDGVIISNTTLSRQGLHSPLARETGDGFKR